MRKLLPVSVLLSVIWTRRVFLSSARGANGRAALTRPGRAALAE